MCRKQSYDKNSVETRLRFKVFEATHLYKVGPTHMVLLGPSLVRSFSGSSLQHGAPWFISSWL
jgi:hypothetical protein